MLLVFCFLANGPKAAAQTSTYSVLHSFTGAADSSTPAASLIQAGDGNFYGTTLGNFYPDFGQIYKLTPNGTFSTVYNFNGVTDGATVFAPLAQGIDGNLYGSTYGNLIFGTDGSAFSVSPKGSFTELYGFTGATDGANPVSGLTLLRDGSFYGTTSTNGPGGNGTLFHVGSSTPLATITAFNKFNGSSPQAPPVEGTDGNFYGVTTSGGTFNVGSVYMLTPGGTLTTIYSFTASGDGAAPAGSLIEGPDGNFYGATSGGNVSTGADMNGTLFRITPGGVLTTLHSFDPVTEGSAPHGIFLGGDGAFYGITSAGGANGQGAIFRASTSGAVTVLYSVRATDATAPQAGLIQASDGSLWGTGASGGTASMGGVFRLALTPALAPPVTLKSSANTVPLGDSVTLSWNVANAFSNTMRLCSASIDPAPPAAAGWSGLQGGTFDAARSVYSGSSVITPQYPGTYTYGVTCGGVESATATLTIGSAAALTIVTQSLPTAYVGTSYSQPIEVSGGVQPYKFAIVIGALPQGLSLDPSTGTISGTPTASGSSNFTVQVTDSNATGAATTSQQYSPTVLQPLKLSTTSLPNDRIGTPYSQQLIASGGTPPYKFSLRPGSSLPSGLQLSSSGLISGTPSVAGTTNFTLLIADSASQSITPALSITVDPLLATTGQLTLSPSSINIGGTTKATLTIVPPPGAPTPTGTVQFMANGQAIGQPVNLVGNVASLTTPPFSSSGTQVITGFYSGDSNFVAAGYPSSDLLVSIAPQPAIAITPSMASVVSGGTATVTATLSNFGAAAVTLACGNTPPQISCSFSPVMNGSATLTISTFTYSSSNTHRGALYFACLLPWLLLGTLGGKRRRKFRNVLFTAILMSLGMSLVGCGDKDLTIHEAGTGTSTVNVTATAGSQTASTAFTLNVHN